MPDTTRAPHCVVFKAGQPQSPLTDLGTISELLTEHDTLVWFDIVDPGPNDLALVQEEFALHPLAVEDAVNAHQRPKIEPYEHYWFVVVHGATHDGGALQTHEIAIFAGEKFVVTVRHTPPYPLTEIERRWKTQARTLPRDAGFLLYTILDTVVDGYFPIAEAFEERTNTLELSLFDVKRQDTVLRDIFAMKREVQVFRHAAVPMREVLTPILRRDLAIFPESEGAYYRDVYDHTIRLIDQMDTARDLINTALDIHLSVTANRQNDTNKQLALIATIFLPMSFITGFFGQNFGVMINAISGTRAFWLLGVGIQVLVVLTLILYFRSRRWL